jgi:hypothetical protein
LVSSRSSRDVSQYNPTANVNLLTKVEINISIGIYQITSHNEVFADIHDIELTGGIETSIGEQENN